MSNLILYMKDLPNFSELYSNQSLLNFKLPLQAHYKAHLKSTQSDQYFIYYCSLCNPMTPENYPNTKQRFQVVFRRVSVNIGSLQFANYNHQQRCIEDQGQQHLMNRKRILRNLQHHIKNLIEMDMSIKPHQILTYFLKHQLIGPDFMRGEKRCRQDTILKKFFDNLVASVRGLVKGQYLKIQDVELSVLSSTQHPNAKHKSSIKTHRKLPKSAFIPKKSIKSRKTKNDTLNRIYIQPEPIFEKIPQNKVKQNDTLNRIHIQPQPIMQKMHQNKVKQNDTLNRIHIQPEPIIQKIPQNKVKQIKNNTLNRIHIQPQPILRKITQNKVNNAQLILPEKCLEQEAKIQKQKNNIIKTKKVNEGEIQLLNCYQIDEDMNMKVSDFKFILINRNLVNIDQQDQDQVEVERAQFIIF